MNRNVPPNFLFLRLSWDFISVTFISCYLYVSSLVFRKVCICLDNDDTYDFQAVDKLYARRVGHGYHVLDDEGLYERMRQSRIHFEVCPCSSVITGSVPLKDHPLLRYLGVTADRVHVLRLPGLVYHL